MKRSRLPSGLQHPDCSRQNTNKRQITYTALTDLLLKTAVLQRPGAWSWGHTTTFLGGHKRKAETERSCFLRFWSKQMENKSVQKFIFVERWRREAFFTDTKSQFKNTEMKFIHCGTISNFIFFVCFALLTPVCVCVCVLQVFPEGVKFLPGSALSHMATVHTSTSWSPRL